MTTKPKLIVPKHVWDGKKAEKEKKANNDYQSGGDRFDTKNFATSGFGKFLSSASNTASNTASNFGSGVTTGINYLGTGINYSINELFSFFKEKYNSWILGA